MTSQENVEAVRRFLEAWNRRDLDAALHEFHPDAEITAAPTLAGYRSRGHAEMRSFWTSFYEGWEELRAEPTEFIQADDQVIAVIQWSGRGRDGIELRQHMVDLYTFEDGLCVRLEGFKAKSDALKAAGLPT